MLDSRYGVEPLKNVIAFDLKEGERSTDTLSRASEAALFTVFQQKLSVNHELQTDMIVISYEAEDPQLAAFIVNRVVNIMDDFFRNRLQTAGKEQIAAITKRQMEVSDSLRLAEDQFEDFSETNRSITGSPQLQLTANRLQRRVSILSSVYANLSSQLESARLLEAKDAPVLRILDRAKVPVINSGPPRRLIAISFFLLGFAVVVGKLLYAQYKELLRALWSGSKPTDLD